MSRVPRAALSRRRVAKNPPFWWDGKPDLYPPDLPSSAMTGTLRNRATPATPRPGTRRQNERARQNRGLPGRPRSPALLSVHPLEIRGRAGVAIAWTMFSVVAAPPGCTICPISRIPCSPLGADLHRLRPGLHERLPGDLAAARQKAAARRSPPSIPASPSLSRPTMRKTASATR